MSIVDIKAKLVHQTDKAFLFDFGLDDKVWIPKSQCEWDPSDQTVAMEEETAIDKGLDNLI